MLQAPPLSPNDTHGNVRGVFFIEELEAWVRCLECFKHPGLAMGRASVVLSLARSKVAAVEHVTVACRLLKNIMLLLLGGRQSMVN